MNGLCSACGKPTVIGSDCAYCISQSAGKQAALVSVSAHWNEHDSDSPRFVRRLLFGVVSVFGLFAGLVHLITAGMLMFDESAVPNERLLIGVLLASCLIGGLIAGTANRKAELTGISIGILAAFGHLWQLNRTGETLPGEWWIGFPIISAVVGLLAGFSGRLIYPPSPRMSLNSDANLTGIAQSLGSMGGSNLVIWQLTGLAALMGGLLSGNHTKAGVIQGISSGFISGIAINILHLKCAGLRQMGLEFWQSISGFNKNEPQLMAIVLAFTVMTGALGGWLGSRLFQPSSRRKRPRY